MKIGVVIPDRGDRPRLMENCRRMLDAQTLPPAAIVTICDPPSSEACDITKRYRQGYTIISKMDVDVIAFIENDDWYAMDYLEVMAKSWENHGRPQIFGTNYTIYYHIKLRRYFIFDHFDRASMMNTLIVPGLPINWCADENPYTDMWLWGECRLTSKTFKPNRPISLGIKHGEGKSGGDFHTNLFDYFKENDNGFLERTLDPVSFQFYDNYFQE